MKTLIAAMIFFSATPLMAESLVYEGTEGIGKGKHIVFVANDHEYRSEQSCPLMAKILAKHHGFKCTVLFGVDEAGFIKAGAGDVPGLEVLQDADLIFFFTRFMSLPNDQAQMIVDYFERGGPVVSVRTSTHCFNRQQGEWAKLNFDYKGEDYLGGLGEQVFGNTWNKERGQSHYGSNHVMGCRITPVAGAKDHPILKGIDSIHAYSGAYDAPVPKDGNALLEVQVLNTFGPSDEVNAERPLVNAGYTRDSYVAPSGEKKNARVVYTSMGASEDLLDQGARRFFVNACLWAASMESSIQPDLDVSIVGTYSPSPYTNGAYFYEGVKPLDLAGWDSGVMPQDAKLAGVDSLNHAAKHRRVLSNRPELKAKLAKTYPELYGPDVKLPETSKNKKKTPAKKAK
ncbi:MAG: hypothetical protein AB8B91_03210 [Rubripirellula sp.]